MDSIELEDRPTWIPPEPPGTPPCQYLGCGCGPTQRPCVPGTNRCAEHQHTRPTIQMRAATLEAFAEACRE